MNHLKILSYIDLLPTNTIILIGTAPTSEMFHVQTLKVLPQVLSLFGVVTPTVSLKKQKQK